MHPQGIYSSRDIQQMYIQIKIKTHLTPNISHEQAIFILIFDFFFFFLELNNACLVIPIWSSETSHLPYVIIFQSSMYLLVQKSLNPTFPRLMVCFLNILFYFVFSDSKT